MVGVRIAECSTSEAAGRRHPPGPADPQADRWPTNGQ